MEFIASWVGVFIAFFIAQILLCFKIKNKLAKFIPAALVAVSYIIAIVFYVGGIAGLFPEGGTFAAAFILIYSSADLLACFLAWLIYLIAIKLKSKKQ